MDGYTKGTQPDVQWWMRQIRHGIRFRKESAFEAKWPQWRKYYRGCWKPGIMPSNIFFKMVRTIVPRIYFRNPSVSVISRKPGAEGYVLAKLVERTDNKLIGQMQMKKHMKRQVQNTFMFGSGVGKLGFGSQYHASPESVGITEAPRFSQDRESVEYNFDMLPNMPWYTVWPTSNYVLPANCAWRESCRWECFISRRPLDDVRRDTRLKFGKLLKPMVGTLELDPQEYKPTRMAIDEVDLYEIRDKKTGRVFIISPQLPDKPLVLEDDGYLSMGIEVGNLTVFNEDDERVWGIPDPQILEPLQRELNEVKTMIMYHRRLSVIKMLIKQGAMTKEEAEKMLSEDVLAIVWTEEDPDRAVKLLQASDVPQALLRSEIGLMDDVRETLGFSRNEFGEFQGGRESPTATEAQIVKIASEIRVEERRDMMADLMVSVMTDSNKLIFKHWTEEQVIDVVGPAGIPIWVRFKPALLGRGQYEISIDPDQTVPRTKEIREQKALLLYRELRQNPMIDPFQLTQYLLHELHGVAFDSMLAGLPRGAGVNQSQPFSIDQFSQFVGNVGRRAPQLLGASPRAR